MHTRRSGGRKQQKSEISHYTRIKKKAQNAVTKSIFFHQHWKENEHGDKTKQNKTNYTSSKDVERYNRRRTSLDVKNVRFTESQISALTSQSNIKKKKHSFIEWRGTFKWGIVLRTLCFKRRLYWDMCLKIFWESFSFSISAFLQPW